MIHDVDYVSVWDDSDAVVTSAKYDDATGRVFDIETAEEPAGASSCTREYIQFGDQEIEIDPELENEARSSDRYVEGSMV